MIRKNAAIDVADALVQSPPIQRLHNDKVSVVVPLISQGEFFGLLELGPRLDRQDYARDELNLLSLEVAWTLTNENWRRP